MPFETMRTFFALSALAANAAAIILLIVGLAGRRGDKSPFKAISGATMSLAGGVALAATLGSLYLSEIVHLIPCKFCWYQRIAMYPIALILLIAAARKDAHARLYAVTLAAIGGLIATWHRLIQAYPRLDSGACAASGPPCSAPYIKEFGFITIPYMALSAFVLILVLLWADRINTDIRKPTSTAASDSPLKGDAYGR